MIRIGIIGFDTSHAVEFTKRINHVSISEDQWVGGARVVIGYPGEPSSFVTDEVLAQRTETIREFGVHIADSSQVVIGKIDAIMLESQDGGLHLEQAKPFIEAGLPIFIDKPFTCSVTDAEKIAKLARDTGVPVFSSSSLRYTSEVQNLKARTDLGAVLGVDVYSPGPTHTKNPGLFNYGIHGVEMLYALMGTGCKSVRCIWTEQWEKAVGQWRDGRIGTIRALRKGATGYGFTAFCENTIIQSVVDTRYIYRELLKKVIEMFRTKRPPIDIDETIEIMAFIEASLKSSNKDGANQNLSI